MTNIRHGKRAKRHGAKTAWKSVKRAAAEMAVELRSTGNFDMGGDAARRLPIYPGD